MGSLLSKEKKAISAADVVICISILKGFVIFLSSIFK
jgi:hypothetical protein